MAVALAACGGGSGGGVDPAPGPDPRPAPPLACTELDSEFLTTPSATGSSEWNDVLIDPQGRIWLAGYRDGVLGQTNIEPAGPSRAVLRQLSQQGQTLASADDLFGTAGTDVAEALALDASGRLYVAGRSSGSLPGQPNQGQFDTVLAWSERPADASTWQARAFGNQRPQHPRRLRLAGNGDVVVAGYDDDHVPSNFVETWSDPYALRLRFDSTGAPQTLWTHAFNSAEPDLVDGLALDTQGATYLGGTARSGPLRGLFLRKLDAAGQVLWTARYSTSPADNLAAVELLDDGTLLIAGSVVGSFQGATPIGGQDIVVARVDARDGRVLQRWQLGTPGADWLVDMKVGRDGAIHLFGETDGSFMPGQPAPGDVDLFLLKLSADGQVLAQRQGGGVRDQFARRLAVDTCGRVVAVGSTVQASGQRAALLWSWRP